MCSTTLGEDKHILKAFKLKAGLLCLRFQMQAFNRERTPKSFQECVVTGSINFVMGGGVGEVY